MNKLFYNEHGGLIDSVTHKTIGAVGTEENARYVAGCVNACLGVGIDRIEQLSVLPMFLELRRLQETVSDSKNELDTLRASVKEYEKALKNVGEFRSFPSIPEGDFITGRFTRAGGE